MAEDLEDFLRRAAERRKQQAQAKPARAADAAPRAPVAPPPQQRQQHRPNPVQMPDGLRRGESAGEARRLETLRQSDELPTSRGESAEEIRRLEAQRQADGLPSRRGESADEIRRLEALRQAEGLPVSRAESDAQARRDRLPLPELQRPRRNEYELKTRPFESQIGSSLDERRRLADEVSQADERMEARLRRGFEHTLGQLDEETEGLATRSPRPEDAMLFDAIARDPQAAAEMFAASFRDPRFIKTAFIASEVFQRKF